MAVLKSEVSRRHISWVTIASGLMYLYRCCFDLGVIIISCGGGMHTILIGRHVYYYAGSDQARPPKYSACLVSKKFLNKCCSSHHIESCDTCMEH